MRWPKLEEAASSARDLEEAEQLVPQCFLPPDLLCFLQHYEKTVLRSGYISVLWARIPS